MQDFIAAAQDFAAFAIFLSGLGLWCWWDLMRNEINRKKWLEVNNPELYKRLYEVNDE